MNSISLTSLTTTPSTIPHTVNSSVSQAHTQRSHSIIQLATRFLPSSPLPSLITLSVVSNHQSNDEATNRVQSSAFCALEQKAALAAIRLNPKCFEAFYSLGRTLSREEFVEIEGEKLFAKDCYIQAIEYSPPNEYAFRTQAFQKLIMCLSDQEFVILEGQQLFKLDCYSFYAESFYRLGNTLSQGEFVEIEGKKFFAQDCYKETIKYSPSHEYALLAQAFNSLAKTMQIEDDDTLEDSVQFWHRGPFFSTTACYIEGVSYNPLWAQGFIDLGDALSNSERPHRHVMVNGEELSAFDCYHRAIELNPECGIAFYKLARLLGSTAWIVSNGTSPDRQNYIIQAIKCAQQNDPELAPSAFLELGNILAEGGSAEFDGKSFSAKDCYIKVTQYDSKKYRAERCEAFLKLGQIIEKEGQSAKLTNGEELSAKDCYVQAIQCDTNPNYSPHTPYVSNHSCAFYHLGNILNETGESVTLKDGHFSAKDCYVKIIEIGGIPDPYLGRAFYNLGNILNKTGESVTLKEWNFSAKDENFSAKDCYARAIRFAPWFADPYFQLSEILKEGEFVTIDSNHMTINRYRQLSKQQCYELGLRQDPHYGERFMGALFEH